jgi:DNA-binding PadR family transcriptional regulator
MQEAILALLTKGPAHGYELRQRLTRRLNSLSENVKTRRR